MTDSHVPAELKEAWWLLLILGVASAGLGIALIFWPGRTLTVVLIVVGIYMLIFGLVRFVIAVFDSDVEYRWLQAFLGIVGFVFGLVVIRQPEGALALIVLLVGLFWLIVGFVDLFRGITGGSAPDRGLRIGLAVVAIGAGAVLLLWPAATVAVLAIIAGIQLAISGIFEVVAAFQLKNA
jgi:uncharacterized membrane protein HdeD (DUF308 family)